MPTGRGCPVLEQCSDGQQGASRITRCHAHSRSGVALTQLQRIFKKPSDMPQVTPEDIYRVMPLCLRHRLRKDPLEQIDSGEKVQDTFKVGALFLS